MRLSVAPVVCSSFLTSLASSRLLSWSCAVRAFKSMESFPVSSSVEVFYHSSLCVRSLLPLLLFVALLLSAHRWSSECYVVVWQDTSFLLLMFLFCFFTCRCIHSGTRCCRHYIKSKKADSRLYMCVCTVQEKLDP